jgi:hypothetical protein
MPIAWKREGTSMNLKRVATAITVFLALCFYAVAQEPPPIPGEELPAGAEALTSGPVHEAFAKPVIMEVQVGVVALKPPPAYIVEVPPAQRPAGANVAWVPGYWAWDAGRNDHIWVSGCWRVTPPAMSWIPGYWTPVAGGWGWVPGFWAAGEQAQEIEYLTAPPASIEISPLGPAPSVDVVWVPGCWYWNQGRYVQRHGYWLSPHAGWVWEPSHYSWSPHGYIFCPGHWDYDMDRRGVLFTPVYFGRGVAVRAGFVFSPSICVDLGILRINLFAYPRYNHYYFGDYYDDSFLRIGIYPRFESERYHTWYDPIFVYERWNSRREGPAWEARERHEYDVRRADPAQRPPRTFSEQQTRMARLSEAQRKNFQMAQPLRTFAAAPSTPVKFEQINTAERQKIAVQAKEVHNFGDQRTQWEAPKKGPVTVTQPEKVKIPPAPIIHKPVSSSTTERVAPTHPTEERSNVVAPKDTPKVAPRDTPKDGPKDTPKDAPKDTPKEMPKIAPKDAPNDTPKDAPTDTPTDAPKDHGKPDGKDDGKDGKDDGKGR